MKCHPWIPGIKRTVSKHRKAKRTDGNDKGFLHMKPWQVSPPAGSLKHQLEALERELELSVIYLDMVI